MSDSQFTRCPGCATVYRVTAAQLALREGQVRCGHCRAVFDASAHRVDLAPPAPSSAATEVDDELARGRATVTLRDSRALEPAPEAEREDAKPEEKTDEKAEEEAAEKADEKADEEAEENAEEEGREGRSTVGESTAAEPPLDVAELAAARAALRPRRRRSRSGNTFYVFAILVLVAGIVVQSAAFFRDDIVARMPRAANALDALCRTLECRTGPRRDAGALSIEGSDLQADPGHRGLLVLTATLRNRAGRPVAWPDLELTLTDSSDQAVVRRVLSPDEYVPAAARPTGLAGHSEQQVRLFVDASATRQAGYRLYLFYP
ncbi:MAG TPA: zinc-ribbon and DUF3426 domain-containing protein [Casimicrobiaceae bacterium]|nr:zinc-ribbon and DUF3426 domain-containing protein [Casimicrobiaceae bacterium]